MNKLPITVLIPTWNAAGHLDEVLDSIADIARDVFILDSCSTDETIDIALRRGIKIAQRKFTTFGDHFNWFAKNMPIKTEWIFMLHQDERFSESLKNGLQTLFSSPPPCNGYRINWHLWFMGKPLHISSKLIRLMRKGKFNISNVLANEQILIDGEIGDIDGVLEHRDSLNLYLWNEKQNLYSTMEAVAICKNKGRFSTPPRFWGTALERRMFFKKMFFRIPFRYNLLFFYNYILNGAWRDGRIGWIWSHLRSEVYRMWELKAMEMRITGIIPEIPRMPYGDFDPRVMASELQRQVLPETVVEWEKKNKKIDSSKL